MDLFAHSKLIWNPLDPKATRVDKFRRWIDHRRGLDLKDYHELHRYSVEDYTFWLDLWDYLGIISSVPPNKDHILHPGRPNTPFLPLWFPDARLNYAENVLSRRDNGLAVTTCREDGIVTHYTFRELSVMVQAMAAAFRVNGLAVGDRVAAVITNSIEAIVIALATASCGAIFSSTAPDMGAAGILDRYRQIGPKFIFLETEVVYAGQVINLVPKVVSVVKELAHKGLQRAILLPSTKTGKVNIHKIAGLLGSAGIGTTYSDFVTSGDLRPLTFEQLPFSHPLWILYSSGTSGPPKCIVHSAGGSLLQHKKDGSMSFNLYSDDTYFQYTSTGWVVWPFLVSTLALGVRIIAYDGSPFHPDVRKFVKFISDQHVTVLGISPRFLTEVKGRGVHPLDLGAFESLRVLFCTGAVLTPPMFHWAQNAFGKEVHVASGCGGTDIAAAFLDSVPSMPVYAGETQGKSLGMKVEVFDPAGNNIEHTGERGELVCTRPHPSLPICFWGDENGEKFRNAYFSHYPGVWRQGDYIAINPKTRGIIILGRSDGVLNPSGIRFGSGEIYTVLERFSALIDDAICVGQRRPGKDEHERVFLFIKMRTEMNGRLDDKLKQEIREAIASASTKRHVPSFIFEVEAIPYTVNNKKIEIAVKQIISGYVLKPSGTVANPGSLELYYKYRDIADVGKAKL